MSQRGILLLVKVKRVLSIRLFLTVSCLIFFTFLSAQSREKGKIQIDKKPFPHKEILKPFSTLERDNNTFREVIQGRSIRMNIDPEFTAHVIRKQEKSLHIQLPIPDQEEAILQLQEVSILSEDFRLINGQGQDITHKAPISRTYRGIVEGRKTSMVVLTVFNNEVSGMIDLGEETFTIGKIKNDTEYIIFREEDLINKEPYECFSDDLPQIENTERDRVKSREVMDVNNCVRMYLEADYDLYSQFGNVNETYDYIVGAFSQVTLLYSNESINITINELKIWDTEDPYIGKNSDNEYSTGVFLTEFKNSLGSGFNGDLAHLIGSNGNGGIAYLDVLCNKPNGFGYSGVNTFYNTVPTYSWTVEVLTHEIGHNLGSPHTHACVWNGNNTAIDRCGQDAGDESNGTCDQNAPIPSKGTIMSYCHLLNGVGIDFNLGFGPQPGDLIRDRVYNAACLSSCVECNELGNSCDDGDPCTINDFIDSYCNCTGTALPDSDNDGICDSQDPDANNFCIPSPGGSFSELSISIKTDRYPEETSWELNDDNGITLFEYSSYTQSNSLILQNICLEDGCYEFVIFDSYGDGICCNYGNGEYQLIDYEGNIIASGGNFESSESTTFCYNNFPSCTPGDTCDDGDPCTENDIYDANCDCAGSLIDQDEDGICDTNDPCYDPVIMTIDHAIAAGSYSGRSEIRLEPGTLLPSNSIIYLNAPIIRISDEVVVPTTTYIETSSEPCSN